MDSTLAREGVRDNSGLGHESRVQSGIQNRYSVIGSNEDLHPSFEQTLISIIRSAPLRIIIYFINAFMLYSHSSEYLSLSLVALHTDCRERERERELRVE